MPVVYRDRKASGGLASSIPVISNVTGAALSGADAFSADYLCEHIRQPVRFHAGRAMARS